MGIDGHMLGLLDERHARGCNGQEYSTVRPVAYGDGIAIIFAEWCGECGACDWELVDTVEPSEEVLRR